MTEVATNSDDSTSRPEVVLDEATPAAEATLDWPDVFEGDPRRWGLMILSGLILGGGAFFVTDGVTGSVESGFFTTLAWAVVLSVLPILTRIDLAIRRLPDAIVKPTAALAGALLLIDAGLGNLGWEALVRGLVSGVIVGIVFFAILVLAPQGGFGFGDVKLAATAALVLGTHSWALPLVGVLLLPPLLGLVPALVIGALRRDMKQAIPFGPFIALAIVAAAFGQDSVTNWLTP